MEKIREKFKAKVTEVISVRLPIFPEVKKKSENCCLGMDNCIKQEWVEKDVIEGGGEKHVFYVMHTNKTNGSDIIGVVLIHCLCCGKKIYPDESVSTE